MRIASTELDGIGRRGLSAGDVRHAVDISPA
jgi:hypothetical protein